MTSTLDVSGAQITYAMGISNQGVIAGIWFDNPMGHQHSFLYSGGVYQLVDVPGSDFTQLSGVNSSGVAVGGFSTGGDGNSHGLIRSATGGLTTIDVPGAKCTMAVCINDNGQIAGIFGDPPNSARVHGFLRSCERADLSRVTGRGIDRV
jgi:hypothetical protein